MMPQKPSCCVFALALLSLLTAAPALAWNPSGHETIALIAYGQLNDATKAQAIALLKAHPRLREHFAFTQRREVGRESEAQQDEWLFAFASTWPDIVRDAKDGVSRGDVQKYNRSWWHFVDLPVFLNEAEQKQLAPHVKVNLRRDAPDDRDDPNMNVIQAIKNSSRIVSDSSAPAELRSIHLCWLLHLVGDAHQPLHSTALFTSQRFPEGDHGGNYLDIEHDYNLHAFWDDQVSTEKPYQTIRRLAHDVARNSELAAAGAKATATLDPGVGSTNRTSWRSNPSIRRKSWRKSPPAKATATWRASSSRELLPKRGIRFRAPGRHRRPPPGQAARTTASVASGKALGEHFTVLGLFPRA